MRPVLLWVDKVSDEAGATGAVYDIAFKPDGTELLVAAECRVHLYDAIDGTRLQTLKGHKDIVITVAWSSNGETFASGSLDKSVILWNEAHEGTLKYTHSDAIQRIMFNPVNSILLSCAINDFGLWTTADKNVVKQRVESKCCSCDWSSDGTMFAIGHFDGTVSLRRAININDENYIRIVRGTEPVWTLAFSCNKGFRESTYGTVDINEILAVGDWSNTLSFYKLDGTKAVEKDILLDYEPQCMKYCLNGQFLLIGGSNKFLLMYTRTGVLLGSVAQMDNWIWSVNVKPNSHTVALGCVDGTIASYNLMFSTVHGLDQERYAYREAMTDVHVQNLLEHTRTRIRCYDHVKKVALYGPKLAIQLSDKIVIYKQTSGPKQALEYKLTDTIPWNFDCSLLVVTSVHYVVCYDETLICYDQKGMKQREWIMTSHVRYIKVIGGPSGRETLAIGTLEGEVYKVYLDNPYAILICKRNAPIKCVDLNADRTVLATIEDNGLCSLINLKTNETLLQEPGCNSVCFNSTNEQMFAYTTRDTMNIRSIRYPGHSMRMMGFVVGFVKNKAFCLHLYMLHAIEVPFTIQMYQFIEHKQLEEALKVAFMGVVEEDWIFLAKKALEELNFDVADKAFTKIKDRESIVMVNELKRMKKNGDPDVFLRAYTLACFKRVQEAAALYRDNGFENKAMEMFTDLRMFDEVQEVMTTASGETKKMLMRKRAIWAKDANQPKVAAEMLISSGDLDKAAALIIENDWLELAIDISRKIDRSDLETTKKLASYFVRKHEYGLATKIYSSINDTKSIVEMHVFAGHWTDAFAIADRHPKYVEDVYLPYARHLAERDQFEEAQKAFHMAGKESEALYVLEQLTNNAVNENRFADAGYYYWLLSQQYLERSQTQDNSDLIPKYHEAAKLAEVYYAYHPVFIYCNQPFSFERSENVLNMAKFLAFQETTDFISRVLIYYTIAKLGGESGAYKSARQALEQLNQFKVPQELEGEVNVMSLNIKAKPMADSDMMQPLCYRCGLNNPYLGGLVCIHCQTPFILSFVTFDVLPLVEFQIDNDISIDEAKELIESEPPLSDSDFNPLRAIKKGVRTISLNRESLARLENGHVIIQKLPPPLAPRFMFNMMPTITISQCISCCKLFDLDDFEMAVLQKGHCPFCRTSHERNDAFMFDDEDDDGANKKIPYAEPPLEKLRFKKLRFPKPWKHVLNGTAYGPACPANTTHTLHGLGWMDEDCIHINIFTNQYCLENKNCSVVSMYHGGSGCHSNGVTFNDTALFHIYVRNNIVVTVPQYRLGVLSHFTVVNQRVSPVNLLLHDITHSLEFIQKMIPFFGGNPKDVTIMGHSAGGAFVGELLFSPYIAEKNLFVKVISLSPAMKFHRLENAINTSQEFAKRAGCYPKNDHYSVYQNEHFMIECLQKVNISTLMSIQHDLENDNIELNGVIAAAPFFEGPDYRSILKMGRSDIPWLVGSTIQEYDTDRKMELPRRLGFDNPELIDHKLSVDRNHSYFGKNINNMSEESLRIVLGTYEMATVLSDLGAQVYFYQYSYPKNTEHGKFLIYYNGQHFYELDDNEIELFKIIPKYYSNFIKTGIPDKDWKLFNTKTTSYMDINYDVSTGLKPKMRNNFEKETMEYWFNDLRSLDQKMTSLKNRIIGKLWSFM